MSEPVMARKAFSGSIAILDRTSPGEGGVLKKITVFRNSLIFHGCRPPANTNPDPSSMRFCSSLTNLQQNQYPKILYLSACCLKEFSYFEVFELQSLTKMATTSQQPPICVTDDDVDHYLERAQTKQIMRNPQQMRC